MVKLSGVVEFVSGTPQFRITEVFDKDAPIYTYYSQHNMADDLVDLVSNVDGKQVEKELIQYITSGTITKPENLKWRQII